MLTMLCTNMRQLLNIAPLLVIHLQLHALAVTPQCGIISNCRGPSCSGRSPWHAVILPGTQYENLELCGGTLISENLVITAAICVQSKKITALEITVILGAGSGVYTSLTAKTTFIHSAENTTEDRNIALIKLDEPITDWNDSIGYVCLPKENDSFLKIEGKSLQISGFRNVSENIQHVSRNWLDGALQQATLEFANPKYCQNISDDSTQLCARVQQGYHSCIGDSGGGLILKEDNRYTIVGMIFSEIECKSSYNNLAEKNLLHWIGSVMNNLTHGLKFDNLISDPILNNDTAKQKIREGRLLIPQEDPWFQKVLANDDSPTESGIQIITIILICVIVFLAPICIALFVYLARNRIFQKPTYKMECSEDFSTHMECSEDVFFYDQTKEERNTSIKQIPKLCKDESVYYIDDSTEQEKLLHSNVMKRTCSTSTLQSVANFRTLVFENWKPLMKQIQPNYSENIIHSINEVFGLFDQSYHKLITILWNLENVIVEKMEETIHGTKHFSAVMMDDSSLLFDNSKYLNQTLNSLLYQIYGKDTLFESLTNEEDFKLVGINYKHIIVTLLPSHAVPLIDAIELLYPDDCIMKAFAVQHIVDRYAKMKYTSQEDLNIFLKTIKNGNDDTQKQSIMKRVCQNPTLIVDVVLTDDENLSEESANYLRNNLQTSLDDIRTNTRLQDWLWHRYYHNRLYNGLPIEKLTRNDFESISVEVVGIFYGSVIHASVMFKFDMEGGLSNETLLNKLENLEVICKIALENLKDIIPQKHKITCNNSIITVDYDDTSENAETIVLDNLRMVYGRVEDSLDCRKLLLKKLHEKNIRGFNTTEDIVRLFSRREFKNVDKLKIRMSRFDQNQKKTIRVDANYSLWPCKTRPLNEMTNKDLSYIHECFERTIPDKLYKSASKYLIHSLEIFQNSIELSGKMLAAVDTSHPFHQILCCLRENEASIEDILMSLSQFKKEHYNINLSNSENEQLKKSLKTLGESLNKWLENTFEDWKKKYSVVLPSSTMSRSEFDMFIQAPHHDLRQLKKMTKTELFNIVRDNEAYVGVQIWMCRFKKGIHYWHVGILVGRDDGDYCYNIVHVQPRKGIKLEGKIVKEDLSKAVHDDDEILIIYYDQTLSRAQIKQRALLCCQAPKITFKYNGYLGSCETFCSFICGTRSIKDLNTQGFKVRFDPEEGLTKKMVAKSLHFKRESSADDLLSVIQNRLQQRSEILDERLENHQHNFSMDDQDLSDRQLSSSSDDTPTSIGEFLYNLGLSALKDLFLKECVTYNMLLDLSDEHLKEIGIVKFGHRFRILEEAKRVKEEAQNLYISSSSLEPLSSSSGSYGYGSLTSQISFR